MPRKKHPFPPERINSPADPPFDASSGYPGEGVPTPPRLRRGFAMPCSLPCSSGGPCERPIFRTSGSAVSSNRRAAAGALWSWASKRKWLADREAFSADSARCPNLLPCQGAAVLSGGRNLGSLLAAQVRRQPKSLLALRAHRHADQTADGQGH